jgi:hypothetical protein
MPALHEYIHDHLAESHCERSDSGLPVPEDTCPLCELVHSVTPFVTIDEPFPLQTDIVSEMSFVAAIPLAVGAITLPPCRAPPIL